MKRVLIWLVLGWLGTGLLWGKKYQVREIHIRPATEYAAHQDFQEMVFAGIAFNTQETIQQIFDTKALFKRGIMPILIVIENRSNFAVRIHADDIFLIDPANVQHRALKLEDVLIAVAFDRPLSSVSTGQGMPRGKINRKLSSDFQHKGFSEKLIAPGGSDYGVVFFPLSQGEALHKARLYLPEVYNISESEPLIFFEFELNVAQP